MCVCTYASTAENPGKFTKPIGICWLFTYSYVIVFSFLHRSLLISVAPFSMVILYDNFVCFVITFYVEYRHLFLQMNETTVFRVVGKYDAP